MSSVERPGGADTSTQAPSTSLKFFDHLGPQGEFSGIHQPTSGSIDFQFPHLGCRSNFIPFTFETRPNGQAFGSGLTHSDANISTCGEGLDPGASARTRLAQNNLEWPQMNIQPTTDGYPASSWNRHCPPASLRTTPVNRRRRQKLNCCDKCGEGGFTRSELRKHMNTHTLPFRCDFQGCPREVGFSTRNDLDRHKKNVHKDWSVDSAIFICPFSTCRQPGKLWPRADNFRAHLNRVHGKQYSASDDLTEYVHRPPSSQDLEGVGGSVLAYMEDQNQYSDGAPLSEINNPSALHGEESRHQVSLPSETHEALPQTSASMSFDRVTPNLARTQEDDRIYTPPTCLNTTASDNQTAGLLSVSPSNWQSSNPIRQELPGSGHDSPGSEPQSGTPSMPMEQVSQDNQLHIEASGSRGLNNQEPHQSDVGIADAGDTVADITVSMEQVMRGPLSSNQKEVIQVLDRIPRQMIEAYLKQDGSLGPKNDIPGRDAFVDKDQDLTYECQECHKVFAKNHLFKKHAMRHSKPYGCTYPGCSKIFGSKSDWMRHERIRHYEPDKWKCDSLKQNLTEACGEVYTGRQSFKAHLTAQHFIMDSGKITEKLKCCQEKLNYDVSFWCGFCTEIIRVSEPQKGWAQRCTHIEGHFRGRRQPPMHIREWKHEDLSEKEVSSRPYETEPDSPTESSNSDPKPRHGSEPNAGPERSNKAQSNATYMWKCCCCSVDNSFTAGAVCVTCDHKQCSCCEAFSVQPHDIA
ncbi:hypothetical protein NCS56_01547500 [Fusarium sp. Ph1]|nr:hypothetical protein NCS56_01547500 [Fusarium sp. Ph1]